MSAKVQLAYHDNEDFLQRLCAVADLMIERAAASGEHSTVSSRSQSSGMRQRGLRERRLQHLDDEVDSAWKLHMQRMEATLADDLFIPWIHLARMLGLDDSEQQILMIALLPELDTEYLDVLSGLGRATHAQTNLIPWDAAASLLERQDILDACLLSDSPLQRWRLLQPAVGSEALQLRGGFRLDPSIAAYLCGRAAPQLRLQAPVRELQPGESVQISRMDAQTRTQADRFVEYGGFKGEPGTSYVLLLHGPDTIALEDTCEDTFSRLGMACAVLDCEHLAMLQADGLASILDRVQLLCRNAILCNRVLVLTQPERLIGSAADTTSRTLFVSVLQTLLDSQHYVAAINAPARLISDMCHGYVRHRIVPFTIRMELPDTATRRSMWLAGSEAHGQQLSDDLLDRLANTYPFTATRIATSLKELHGRHMLGDQRDLDAQLLDICRETSAAEPLSVAYEVRTHHRIEDVVLPPSTQRGVEELLQYARSRHEVIEHWGFDTHPGGNRNLCVLLHGPSGTGKSMTASVIANELNVGLYRVDLANVMSKYIGETEKQLAVLFEQAEAANVVLCFDEAESLFAKRTEMHDAHDRYANLQTGFLLQRIEAYPGVVVLCTNLLGNIDKAFTRRFRFIIEYPLPSAGERLELWRRAFPKEAPLGDDLDMELLAERAALSGGSIANIALRAAVQASGERGSIMMDHVLHAVESEYDKQGKVYSHSDFCWHEDE